MPSEQPSLEVLREVWPNNGTDEHFEIGPDRDGLDMVEIRVRLDGGKLSANRISFTAAQARLVAQAMLACADEVEVPDAD